MGKLVALAFCFAAACGPGLLQQVQLRQLSDRATVDCKAAGKGCLDMASGKTPACLLAQSKCQAALACATAVAQAQAEIVTLQKQRAGAGATPDQIALAAGAEASARAFCRVGGWQ